VSLPASPLFDTCSSARQGWPDAAKTMAKAAADPAACYALRTAALRVLCCCLAQQEGPLPGAPPAGSVQVTLWRNEGKPPAGRGPLSNLRHHLTPLMRVCLPTPICA
jgi:hypothetical protein